MVIAAETLTLTLTRYRTALGERPPDSKECGQSSHNTRDAVPLACRRAAVGYGRRFETTASVARPRRDQPTGCHLLRGIGRDELLTIAPGVRRWAAPAHRCPRTACASRSCVPTDAGDREIAALTKKIAADEEDLLEDRKVISHHAHSAPRPPCVHVPRTLWANSGGRPHESSCARARARRSGSCSSRFGSCGGSRSPRRRGSRRRRRSRKVNRNPNPVPDPDYDHDHDHNPNPNPNPVQASRGRAARPARWVRSWGGWTSRYVQMQMLM